MSLLFSTTVTKKDPVTPTEVDGIFVPGAETETSFTGNVQPIENLMVQTFDRGREVVGQVHVFSEEQLETSLPDNTKSGTRVLYKGSWYECTSEENWDTDVSEFEDMVYYKYIAEWRELS